MSSVKFIDNVMLFGLFSTIYVILNVFFTLLTWLEVYFDRSGWILYVALTAEWVWLSVAPALYDIR
jgi:uncharacterized membrane protein